MAEPGAAVPGFLLRFHLHPAVLATPQIDEQAVLLKLPSNQFWRLRAKGAKVVVEESLYLGGGEPRRTSQIVLTAEPADRHHPMGDRPGAGRGRRGGGRLINGPVR